MTQLKPKLQTCGAKLTWEGHHLVCDRVLGSVHNDHHMGLPVGTWHQHVWWVGDKVTTVTDSVGVAVSLLSPPEPEPIKVPLDAQGYQTRNTKQRRTDRPMVPVSISSGKGRHWYKTT